MADTKSPRSPVGFYPSPAHGTVSTRCRPSRRDLVTGSIAGATAVGAAVLTGVPTEPQAQPIAANELGYRETDHVRRYYALARH